MTDMREAAPGGEAATHVIGEITEIISDTRLPCRRCGRRTRPLTIPIAASRWWDLSWPCTRDIVRGGRHG